MLPLRRNIRAFEKEIIIIYSVAPALPYFNLFCVENSKAPANHVAKEFLNTPQQRKPFALNTHRGRDRFITHVFLAWSLLYCSSNKNKLKCEMTDFKLDKNLPFFAGAQKSKWPESNWIYLGIPFLFDTYINMIWFEMVIEMEGLILLSVVPIQSLVWSRSDILGHQHQCQDLNKQIVQCLSEWIILKISWTKVIEISKCLMLRCQLFENHVSILYLILVEYICDMTLAFFCLMSNDRVDLM